MLILLDNFDSFTFNIVQSLQALGASIKVMRASTISFETCKGLIIGPGPGAPAQSYASKWMLSTFLNKVPILGICLGHQCIGEFFGGKVIRADKPMHGKISTIKHDDQGIFKGIQQDFIATRYHSLVVERGSLPSSLIVSAETSTGEIMGIRHRQYPIEGVQFHPESCMTESGEQIFKNFLNQTLG